MNRYLNLFASILELGFVVLVGCTTIRRPFVAPGAVYVEKKAYLDVDLVTESGKVVTIPYGRAIYEGRKLVGVEIAGTSERFEYAIVNGVRSSRFSLEPGGLLIRLD